MLFNNAYIIRIAYGVLSYKGSTVDKWIHSMSLFAIPCHTGVALLPYGVGAVFVAYFRDIFSIAIPTIPIIYIKDME